MNNKSFSASNSVFIVIPKTIENIEIENRSHSLIFTLRVRRTMSQSIWIVAVIVLIPIDYQSRNLVENCWSLFNKFNDRPPPAYEEKRLEDHLAQTLPTPERLKSPQYLNCQRNIIGKYDNTDPGNSFRCQLLFEGHH